MATAVVKKQPPGFTILKRRWVVGGGRLHQMRDKIRANEYIVPDHAYVEPPDLRLLR